MPDRSSRTGSTADAGGNGPRNPQDSRFPRLAVVDPADSSLPTDCCVIGGGVIGLSIARELAGRGLGVTVLSRDAARATASWAGGGIFPAQPEAAAGRDASPLERFTALSDRLHRQWAEELLAETGIDNGLRHCGTLAVSIDDKTEAELCEETTRWRRLGVRYDQLSAKDVGRIAPALAAATADGTIRGGFHLPAETQLRPPRHLAALHASCLTRGVVFIEHSEVISLERDSHQITSVRFSRPDESVKTLPVERVCLAAGAWSEGLLADLGVQIPTRPWRGQILLHRTAPGLLGQVVNLGAGYDYLIPREDGRLLVGSTIEDVGFDPTTTPRTLARLEQLVRRLLPATSFGRPERTWAGLRPGSPDGLPTIGRLPGIENGWLATGHYRAGLHLSTGTAVAIADLVGGREPPGAVRAFSAERHISRTFRLLPG